MFIFCYCRRFGEVADSVTLIEDQDEVIDLEEDHDLSSSDEDEDEDIAEETVSTGLLNCTVLLNQEQSDDFYDIQLPKHHRCAAHSLALCAKTAEKAAGALPIHKSVSAKVKLLWRKQKKSQKSAGKQYPS